jgi:predicted unusual protein kinase regulating ubiquinone biosynthesis (AarF/ABC1/UbiB family)
MSEQKVGGVRTGRPSRIAPLVGLAGQTSGETVALALARKGRMAEPADEAERYARRLSRSAGVATRAAQLLWSALVGSAIPADCLETLGQSLTGLGEDTPVMPPDLTAQTVRAALGRVPQDAYAAFDPEPFAAGPISQVHAAVLHDGRWVAVKILYRGVGQALRSALAAAELHAALEPSVRAVAGSQAVAGVQGVAGELRGRVEQVIGLRSEAVAQAEFAAAYRSHPFIRVPGVIAELSTQRMLTTDLADGFSWAEALRADDAARNRWGEALFRLGGAALSAADPGPGNYLFHDDGAVTVLGFRTARLFEPGEVAALWRRDRAVAGHDVDDLRALHAEQCGYDDSNADPERLYAWHSRMRGPLTGPGPATCTPEWAADVAHAALPANRPCGAAHQAPKERRDCLFATDIDAGTAVLLGALRATAGWNAIREERDHGGPAATPLGKLESAWQATRTENPDVN